MGVGAAHPGSPVKNRRRINVRPTTRLGGWAVALAVAFFAFVLAGDVVPRGGALAFACGLAGGVAALVAIVRDRERALIVFAAIVPLVIAIAFELAELIS